MNQYKCQGCGQMVNTADQPAHFERLCPASYCPEVQTFTILIHTTYFENSKFERFDRFSNTNVKHEDLGSALDSLMASASSAGHVLGSISITQNL